MSKSIAEIKLSDLLWPIIIFLTAFIVRLMFLLEFSSSPVFDHPIVDMAYHHDWAKAIAEGHNYIPGPFFRAPFYPIFMGIVYFFFGDGAWPIRIVQALLGSFTAVLTYLTAGRIFNKPVAIIAGFTCAFYGTLIYYDSQLLVPTLAIFLNMVAIYLLVKNIDQPRWPGLALAGLILGISAITKPTILIFTAAVFIWLLIRVIRKRELSLKFAIVFAVAVSLPIIPVTVYNYVKSGELTFIATYGGLNFYIGNNLESDGVSATLPGARNDLIGMMADSKVLAERDVGHELTADEQSTYWFRQTLDVIIHHPGHFIKLLFKKALLLCWGHEYSNNLYIYYFVHQTDIMKPLLWQYGLAFPWGLIFPLGIAGIFLAPWRSSKCRLLILYILTYIPTLILFFVTARYRLPLVPVLSILAGYFVYIMIKKRQTLKTSHKIIALSVLIVLLAIGNIDIFGYDKHNDADGLHTLGIIYSQEGRIRDAEKMYREAIALDSLHWKSINNLAMLTGGQGNIDSAITLLKHAIENTPGESILKYNLAYFYSQQKRYAEVIPLLEDVVEKEPDYLDALNNLAVAYIETDQYEKAHWVLTQALSYAGDYIRALYNLGELYLLENKPDSARYYFERSLKVQPDHPQARYLLDSLNGLPEGGQ